MVAQKGRLLLLKVGDGTSPENFTTIAGLRDTSLVINDTSVDITTKDDDGIRKLLDGKFVLTMSVSGTGVFKDDATINSLRSHIMAGTHANFRVVVPGDGDAGGTYEGEFRIESLDQSGTHDGEVQYSISLASAGNIAFTATP